MTILAVAIMYTTKYFFKEIVIMGNTKNVIAKDCKVYEDLLNAFAENPKNPVERFNKCYDIIENANYYEIHFIISMLKEFENAGPNPQIIIEIPAVKALLEIVNSNGRGRRAFFLDMLEEARERKRPLMIKQSKNARA